ncbi:MAG: GrlR family regulatory protein [Terriglobales bacterium]
MIDGLWTVEFEGVPNFLGGGVVVLAGNRLYGGDSQYYYTGLYDVKDGSFTAMAEITSFVPAPVTIFGTQEKQFGLRITGTIANDLIKATGARADNPSLRLTMTIRKRASLP